ncbi:MAG: penicillin-binding protein [Bdellovibrionaceae bacterium]|nr:penicillin-binding protein [Pseudobdellovibrionaceae bacterium]
MIFNKKQKLTIGIIFGLSLISFFFIKKNDEPSPLKSSSVRSTVGHVIEHKQFPEELEFLWDGQWKALEVHYTVLPDLQKQLKDLLKKHRPDYGSIVGVNAKTGEILFLVDHYQDPLDDIGHLGIKSVFPAASVFKLVTATAAIDQGLVSPETIIPFNGRSHTLYRQNINHTRSNRWTRYIKLKDAFARSINTIFGKLGAFYLGGQTLLHYAKRFGFNEDLGGDLPWQAGQTEIHPGNRWNAVEVASGFNRKSKMSPLQGALMAASVIHEGQLMKPRIIESLIDQENQIVYESSIEVASHTMKPQTAESIQTLMEQTIKRGTSRSAFRSLIRKKSWQEIQIGGKTGSLTSQSPHGKCDWFVGYLKSPEIQIGIAVLTVHKKYWTVKSSYLARKAMEIIQKKMEQHPTLSQRNLPLKDKSS